MECGVFGKGWTQLRFEILYMNGEVDLGYFRDWRYQCVKAIILLKSNILVLKSNILVLKSNILVAEFSDLAQQDTQQRFGHAWTEKTCFILSGIRLMMGT
jgi:hypothetical protein